MEKETQGVVLSVKKQWWLKVNTKAIRKGPLDGATFPHIIGVKYSVDGVEFVKSKWLEASIAPPCEGDRITVVYKTENPKKIRLKISNTCI